MSKALQLFAVNPAGSLAENAPLMLYSRYSEVIYFAQYIHDENNVQELHSMRIASKRLRYTLEVFAPAYESTKAEYAKLLDSIKACQEQIGDIHDCDVRIEQVRDYLNQNVVKKPEIRSGLHNLIEQELTARRKLYAEFLEYWTGLNKDGDLERQFVTTIFSARLPISRSKQPVKK